MIPLKPLDLSLLFDRFKSSRDFLQLFILAASITIVSCNNSSKADHHLVKDSTLIMLPQPGLLEEKEKNNISQISAQWYDQFLKNSNFNGGVIVAKNGNIVFEQYKGSAHLNGHDTVNSQTPFHIASVSKTFTAMAVLKLWQEGKLNIDEEVSKYLTGFNYPKVTVRTLLNHRSGIPNYIYFMDELGWDKKVFIQNKDVLDFLIQHKSEIKNIGVPDRSFTYCNTNYALLALIIEKVSGKSYPQYLSENFFKPLGMNNSFVFTQTDSSRTTPTYDWRGVETPLNFLDAVYGDKNIYSTPENLLLWDRFLRSNILFTPKTLEEAYTPYSNEKAGIRNYGLGWRMNVYPDGKKLIYHNGWWHGNNASFVRLINENITIIVVGNRFCSNIYKTKYLAAAFNGTITGTEEESESAVDGMKRSDSNERKLPKPRIVRKKNRHR